MRNDRRLERKKERRSERRKEWEDVEVKGGQSKKKRRDPEM